MKLIFNGADHEVTGSRHCIEACGKKMLVDCGMEQGRDIYVNAELPFSPADVDYVFLTHAHIDHSGMLPKLYADGFKGQIFTTKATTELCQIMLKDSAHIQESETEWKNRKRMRSGLPAIDPVYTTDDAVGVLEHFVPCDYLKKISICEGVEIRFTDVGHLLGSAAIEVWLTEGGETRKLVFSGDIGNTNQPLIKDPQTISEADYVLIESTYGDRSHGAEKDYQEEILGALKETLERGGNLVVPCFAVGRTQEMLYFLRNLKVNHALPIFENTEVYVDSPLAVEATHIFHENMQECFDEDAMKLVKQGINPIDFPGLKLSVTSDDSKAINFDEKPKVILAAAGMCDAGRIRHHLKHNLWRPECTILFAGYQAEGSMGQILLDGAKEVKLFGESIQVCAHISRINGISGHADREGLLNWMKAFTEKPKQVFVVHGEDGVTDSFASLLETDYGFKATAPYTGAEYDLLEGKWLKEGNKEYIQKAGEAVLDENGVKIPGKTAKSSPIFDRLMGAGQRLIGIIRKNRGGANSDLRKFTDQINQLCDKWDR